MTLSFEIELREDDYLELQVEQVGIDIELRLEGPDGAVLLVLDNPGGPAGVENLAWVATTSGTHQVAISPLSGQPAGKVELRPIILREATREDRRLAEVLWRHVETPLSPLPEERQYWRTERREQLQQLEGLERHLLRARIERASGWLDFYDGRVQLALENFRRALPQVRQFATEWELTALLNDVGFAARLSGNPELARVSFEECLDRAESVGHHSAVATALNNLGVLAQSLGHLEEALHFYDLAIPRWQQLGEHRALGTTLNNVGLGYLYLGRFADAADYLQRSLELRQQTNDLAGEALTLSAIGWVRSLEGNHHRALELYNESLVLRQAVGDPRGEAATLDQRGATLRALGRPRDALDDLHRALTLLRESGNRLSEAHVLANLGETLLELGRPEEAYRQQEAAHVLFDAVGDRQGAARSLASLAEIEGVRGRPKIARQLYEQGIGLIESIRSRLQSPTFRRSYTAARYDTYSDYVDLLIELHQTESNEGHAQRAFEAVERARARELRQGLGGQRNWWKSAAPELRHEEQHLRERISLLESRRYSLLEGSPDLSQGSAPHLDVLEAEIESLVTAYEKLEGKLWATARRGTAPPRALVLSEVQALLPPFTTLLSYHLGERPVVWRIEQDHFSMHFLDAGDTQTADERLTIAELAARTHRSLANSAGIGRLAQAERNATALAEKVLGPVRQELGARVIVVAEGSLAAVPFNALPLASPGGLAASPMVMRHEVLHLPSASVLPLLRRSGSPAPTALMAILADPVFSDSDPRIAGSSSTPGKPPPGLQPARPESRPQLPSRGGQSERTLPPLDRLPASGVEAEAIVDVLAHRTDSPSWLVRLGPEAHRDLLLTGALSDYRILHFATHGWIDDERPTLSGIVLSRLDAAGLPREGFLRIHEIDRLELHADLVVLSACQTALGETVRGEGIVGMAHAFFRAGARRLVVSHWRVDDQATAAFMERFYHHLLLDGSSPAVALARTQRWMLTKTHWRAPFYWGAFTLQGDWRWTDSSFSSVSGSTPEDPRGADLDLPHLDQP